MSKVIVFVTYTMLNPIVGGAFIRAVRLAHELARRGWEPVIFNHGPWLDDPKVEAARGAVQFVALNLHEPGLTASVQRDRFRALDPVAVVMGEGPFQQMELFYAAARAVGRPFVVLDQYYNNWLLPRRRGVDMALLYGLATFWGHDLALRRPYEITPPFIEAVTPPAELPVPADWLGRPWVALVAYDPAVCRAGHDLLARLDPPGPHIIAVSRDPAACARLAADRCIPADRYLALPYQPDAVVFGLFAASAAAIVSNGFIQVMDCLALGCPVVALPRAVDGGGLNGLHYAEPFHPYMSFGEDQDRQLERLRGWLANDPFPPDLRARLGVERRGVAHCANRIEQLIRRCRWRVTQGGWRALSYRVIWAMLRRFQ